MNGIPSGIIKNAGLLGMPRTSREGLVRWENHRTSWDITGNYPLVMEHCYGCYGP